MVASPASAAEAWDTYSIDKRTVRPGETFTITMTLTNTETTDIAFVYEYIEPGWPGTLEITGTFRRAAAKPGNAEVLGDGESYIHWGVDDGGAYLLWRIEGGSSAEWPVCVYDAGELTVLPYGLVEFLARACTGGLPADLQRMFGQGGHEFLHWQDQYRRDTERYGSESYLGG
ncbi:hypothetical protein ACIGZJ_17650 [Kitasatospora sp. NPDC052868]|uniref:hypothetical protein n=1 Tax=Kitasatospora sp. NPDC052868 TaxID=3364060 RepID=UPI0037CB751B